MNANALQPKIDPSRAPSTRIGGRYVIEAELGAGGMGVVSRTKDELTGRVVALKQLRAGVGRTEEALFQREYHTLALLKHPRIIEVYDYGIHAGAPYYTMELLDGADLHALSPLPYREACRYLRDVASSLALLAAHRLVHRDLTARNVRVTSDGRSKLIDFGALSPFGVSETTVGTPPYVPPEAMRALPLDQHADLFALGALAYFLLTRTHAFPARLLRDLPLAWTRRPERPSAVVARLIEQGASLSPVPKALDDLVLSLLSLDAAARPQSAAEAIERLTRAGALEEEPGAPAAESYLLSAALVGREGEVAPVRSLVSRALEGRGGAVLVRHVEGAGATRLLNEIAVDSRLAGATVLQIDGELTRAPYAAARALVQKLQQAVPVEAKAAAPHELDLEWLRGTKTDRPSDPSKESTAVVPLGSRSTLLSALEAWFLAVSKACPLVILADNAHELDEGTSTLLSVLSSSASSHALVVIAAERKGEARIAPVALQRLERAAHVIELPPLSPADTQDFILSLFGSVPNVDRLAQWAHRISGGSPARLMELAEYLVARRVARYSEGTWMLPRELPEDDLPFRKEEIAARKFADLDGGALGLASVLSLHRGRLSLEFCIALARAEKIDAFAALDQLTSSGALVGHEDGYRFSQRAIREHFLERIAPLERKRLHLAIADHLLSPGSAGNVELTDAFSGGWHLVEGGDEARGAEVLRRTAFELFQADKLPEAIPALEAALVIFRKMDRPRNELCGILQHLAAAGYYVERRLADRYGDEALALLAEETGLALARRVRPYVGAYLALLIGLVYALVLHCFGRRGGVRVLNANISVMGGLCASLGGVSAICLDAPGAKRHAAHFEPFAPLGLWHAGAFCYALATRLVGVAEDRPAETVAALCDLLARYDSPRGVLGFPPQLRPLTRSGILYALGALEGFLDSRLALDRAGELEGRGLRLYDMLACQIRANYHAYQGNAELARQNDRGVEMHAMRSGSTWQAEVWSPSSRLVACRRTFDLIGLKRASEELERLSVEIPSLERYARAARASLAFLRGEYDVAIPLLEALHTEAPPRAFIGWTALAGVLGEAYNETGQHERAAAHCGAVVALLSDADRRFAALTLDVELQLAIADARCGRAEDAERRLAALLRLHEPNRGPMTLGAIHRAWVEVARAISDDSLSRYHRSKMDQWFRSTNHPSVIAECERLSSPGDSARPLVQRDVEAEARTTNLASPPSLPSFEGEATEADLLLTETGRERTDSGAA